MNKIEEVRNKFPSTRDLTDTQKKLLNNYVYKNHNYQGVNNLWEKFNREGLNKKGPNYIYKYQMYQWYRNQSVNQTMGEAQPVKRKNTRQIYTSKPNTTYQMDLIDFTSNSYKGFTFYLILIDIFTKYAYGAPLKNKSAESIKKVLNDLINKYKIDIKVIQTDNGGEFKGFDFPNGIKHLKSKAYSAQNQGLVERFNRTLKQQFYKYREATGKNNWNEIFEKLIENINNSYSRTTKSTPKDNEDANEDRQKEIAENIKYQINKDKDELLSIGQQVRVKNLNRNKGEPYFSKDIYTIEKVFKGKNNTRNTYKLSGLPNRYNNTEMRVVNQVVEPDLDFSPSSNTRLQIKNNQNIKAQPRNLNAEVRGLASKTLFTKTRLRPRKK
jgi:transposase InsO family protein